MKYLFLVFVLAVSFATFSSVETSFGQGPPNYCPNNYGPNCGPQGKINCHEICADAYFSCIAGDSPIIDVCQGDLMDCNDCCIDTGEPCAVYYQNP